MLLGEISKDLLTRPLTWKEVLGLLFRLTIFGVATYYSIKWVSDALDPTRKQRIHLKKKVWSLWEHMDGSRELVKEGHLVGASDTHRSGTSWIV